MVLHNFYNLSIVKFLAKVVDNRQYYLFGLENKAPYDTKLYYKTRLITNPETTEKSMI